MQMRADLHPQRVSWRHPRVTLARRAAQGHLISPCTRSSKRETLRTCSDANTTVLNFGRIGAGMVLVWPWAAHGASSGGRMGGRAFHSAGGHNWTNHQQSHQQTSWSSPGSRTIWVSSPPSINIWPQPAVYSYSPVGSIGLGSFLFYSIFGFMALRSLHGLFSSRGSNQHRLKDAHHGEGFTTARVQVALLSSARWIQSELETFAEHADSNSQADLNNILQETVLTLMRNPDYIVYGFAETSVEDSVDTAERTFNRLSLEERSKFGRETIVNVDGHRTRANLLSSTGLSSHQQSLAPQELVAVTILVSVRGHLELASIQDRGDLTRALRVLGSIRESDLLALEVLWSPSESTDALSQEELVLKYPHLLPI